jgi:hypothetical protein
MLAAKMLTASLSSMPLPGFVSSSKNRATASTNTVTAPTSIENGDLLVAVGFSQTASLTVAPPSGFNVSHLDGTSTNTVFIATKVASGESGNYTFTWSSSNTNKVAILVYRNATRVNTIGKIDRASSTMIAAAAITPTYRGTLVAMFANENASAVSTAPSGMTLRAGYDGNTPTLGLYDLSPQEASATGTKTITWGTTGDLAALLFQVTNEPDVTPEFVASASFQRTGTTGTLTVDKPTGTVEGDLMVAVMATSGAANATGGWTGDTGWTEVADQNNTNPGLRLAYKVAGASEASSYTFNQNTSNFPTGCILTYRYAEYDAIAVSFTTAASPLVLPSISPSRSQSVLIAAGCRQAGSITLGTPTSMTARVTDNDTNSPSYIVCDQVVANGPTGTRLMTTASTTNVAGIMLAIKPTRSL